MKSRTPVVLGCVALLGVGLAWIYVPRPEPRRVAAPVTATPVPVAATSSAPAATKPVLNKDGDPVAVFQRAFWRRPGADVRILHAERRDWTDAKSAVQKWQWFIALEAKPEFRRWLIEEKPFELAPVDAGVTAARVNLPPDWFPAAATLAGLTAFGTRGGALFVFLDPKSGRIFATDTGAGFAAAVR